MSNELNEQSKFQVGLPHTLRRHHMLDRTGRRKYSLSSSSSPYHHPPEYTVTSITSKYISQLKI